MGKLVVIDGNAILHRAFHALPPMTNKKGEPTNAVYGLVSMFLRVIQDLKPTHITVAFDEKEPTFRHKALKTYQAQRPPTAEDLSSQFAKARDFLKAAGIPAYSMPGFEADDVIGTIASLGSQFKIKNLKLKIFDGIIIITGDRDQLQLVDDKLNIKLYMPIAGLINAKLFGEAETLERMGVPPSQIDDYKALVGDPSDNYGGVSGIGPKTAIKLLEEFGSFEDIYKNLDKVQEKIREKLEKGRQSGELSHKLATIVRDVPIEIDFEKMDKWDIDNSKVLELFAEFGFKTLTERVKKVGKYIDQEKQTSLF
jgi:DNA polymerase I